MKFAFASDCLLAFLLVGGGSLTASGAASIDATELTCEYLKNPLGLDVRQPRLSWVLRAADANQRGQRQTAAHILVASDRALLDRDKGDLWDSHWMASDRSQLVTYSGKALASGQVCWWKVQVRDERNRVSGWSEPATWSVGLLESSDWTAKWIGTDLAFERKPGGAPPDNTIPDPWFRKSFALESAPSHAMIGASWRSTP